MQYSLAQALHKDAGASPADLQEAVTITEGAHQTAQQVLGKEHPLTRKLCASMNAAQFKHQGHDPAELLAGVAGILENSRRRTSRRVSTTIGTRRRRLNNNHIVNKLDLLHRARIHEPVMRHVRRRILQSPTKARPIIRARPEDGPLLGFVQPVERRDALG